MGGGRRADTHQLFPQPALYLEQKSTANNAYDKTYNRHFDICRYFVPFAFLCG
jgi:hypothetical protein